MINLHKRMLLTQRGSNPQPPDHQLDAHLTELLRQAKTLWYEVESTNTQDSMTILWLSMVNTVLQKHACFSLDQSLQAHKSEHTGFVVKWLLFLLSTVKVNAYQIIPITTMWLLSWNKKKPERSTHPGQQATSETWSSLNGKNLLLWE